MLDQGVYYLMVLCLQCSPATFAVLEAYRHPIVCEIAADYYEEYYNMPFTCVQISDI